MNGSKQLPKVISKEQAGALLEQPNVSCPTGLRNRVALELMYRAGLRVSEVVNLKPGHIDWEQDQVQVKNGKGGRDRVVPVDQDTIEWLSRWEAARPKQGGRFFTTLQGKPLSRVYLWGMVKRAAKKAGIDPDQASPHTLRHCYASEKLDEGFTVREVQELLGHSNVQTTSIYLHVNPKALREKIQGRRSDLAVQIAALEAQLAEVKAAAGVE